MLLSKQEIEAIRNLITERTGIFLRDHQMPVLQDTITSACVQFGYSCAEEYHSALARKRDSSPEFESLLAGITVGESYFFRDAAQMKLLREDLLPSLITQKRLNNDYSLRIWSAGCSDGQEIYSVVIMLYEILPDIKRWTLSCMGTDINMSVLANAIQGNYREWSLRETPKPLAEKYFVCSNGDKYNLINNIRQHVKFTYLNLAEDTYPSLHTATQTMDMILCRNVFIYIKPIVVQRILKKFAKCLVHDGLLLLGPSDFSNWEINDFNRFQADTTSYLKRKLDLQDSTVVNTKNQVSSQRVNEADKRNPENPASTTCVTKSYQGIDNILELLRAERWNDVSLLVDQTIKDQGVSADLLQIKAKALANLGYLDEALQSCRKSLTLNPTDKHIYLLQGVIFIEYAKPDEAERALRKAIFLDYAFSEAHYQLGLLHIHGGNYRAGLKCLTHAVTHAKRVDQQREVHNAPGMSYARFVEIISNEMKIYSNLNSSNMISRDTET